ncbi:hypothetical protein N5079_33920, partial [Planotetraspora sp. A-T 1434]|uniref:hypothetical protein n=1 Tax=Planotetraspora sp. A-T 1434 TaxID=2979219 RepID=UPI0021BF41A3
IPAIPATPETVPEDDLPLPSTWEYGPPWLEEAPAAADSATDSDRTAGDGFGPAERSGDDLGADSMRDVPPF